MSTPDYPDWSPGAVNVAAGVTVYSDLAVPAQGFTTGFLDTSRLNSVNVYVGSEDTSAFNPIELRAVWLVGDDYAGCDYFTVGNGDTVVGGSINNVVTLPCRGDKLVIEGSAAVTAATLHLVVNGSARTTPGITAELVERGAGSILAVVPGTSIAAGGSLTVYYGPTSGPVNIACSGSTDLIVRAITYYLSGGAWQVARISSKLVFDPDGAIMAVNCPDRLCAAVIENRGTTSHGANLWVTEAA